MAYFQTPVIQQASLMHACTPRKTPTQVIISDLKGYQNLCLLILLQDEGVRDKIQKPWLGNVIVYSSLPIT